MLPVARGVPALGRTCNPEILIAAARVEELAVTSNVTLAEVAVTVCVVAPFNLSSVLEGKTEAVIELVLKINPVGGFITKVPVPIEPVPFSEKVGPESEV